MQADVRSVNPSPITPVCDNYFKYNFVDSVADNLHRAVYFNLNIHVLPIDSVRLCMNTANKKHNHEPATHTTSCSVTRHSFNRFLYKAKHIYTHLVLSKYLQQINAKKKFVKTIIISSSLLLLYDYIYQYSILCSLI